MNAATTSQSEVVRPLTDKQKILQLMREGWELGSASRTRGSVRFWLQFGGCSRGGKSLNVHASTARSMYKQALIEIATKRDGQSYWLTRYQAKLNKG
jgi:hypothetical protein